MQNASGTRIEQQLENCVGNVLGIGRCGEFVGDCIDLFPFARALDDGIDKTRAIRTEDPGDADHKMLVVRLQNQFLPFPLRFTVNADRVCWIAFGVGLALLTVKYVIGAEMNEPRILVLANFRKDARGLRVDPKSLVALPLTKINIGKGGRINENLEIKIIDLRVNFPRITEIDLRVIKCCQSKMTAAFAR